MKILHVIPGLSSLLGGPSEVCINSVRQLRSLGVDAEIITTNYKLPQIAELDSGELVDFQGVPVRFFSHSKLHYHEYIPSTSLKKWLDNNIRNYSLLDLHYLFTHSTTVASKIAFKNKVPYTLRLMGQLEPWCLSNNQLIKRIYLNSFDKDLFKNASSIQCTSDLELKNATNFGLSKLALIPLGTSRPQELSTPHKLLREKYKISNSSTILLFLGRLHNKKRVELALEIAKRSPQIELLIAGDGDKEYLSSLQSLASDLNIMPRIHFLGHLVGEDKELVLQGSDAFILCSHSENFAVAAAEALVRGLPTILSPEVGLSEFVRNIAPNLILNPDTSDFLEQASDILKDKNELREMGITLQQRARDHLSWESCGEKLLQHYQKRVE